VYKETCLSPKIYFLFSSSVDATIRCWDLDEGRCIREFAGHLNSVFPLMYIPRPRLMLEQDVAQHNTSDGNKATCVRAEAKTVKGKTKAFRSKAKAVKGKAKAFRSKVKANAVKGEAKAFRGKAKTVKGKAKATKGEAKTKTIARPRPNVTPYHTDDQRPMYIPADDDDEEEPLPPLRGTDDDGENADDLQRSTSGGSSSTSSRMKIDDILVSGSTASL